MNHRPHATKLLNTARNTVKNLIGELPNEKQYDALMILNAMAIASREMASSDQDAALELEGFNRFYQLKNLDEKTLLELNRRLAREIREQRFDNNSDVYDFLFNTVIRKLRVSNPKYLRKL